MTNRWPGCAWNMTNYWLWNWKGGRDAVLNQNENAIKETLCLDCGF